MVRRLLLLACVGLSGCEMLAELFSTDQLIEASCVGDDTVVVDGRDLCQDFERHGKVECEVGYRIKLNGTTVCPPPLGQEPL
jgi:hypothetical protein